MYGGLVAVTLSVPLLAALDLGFWAFWDVGAIVMLIGMVFTRVGCLLNGCCSGQPTDGRFGLALRDRSGISRRRIPTQLLEAGLGAAVLAAVWTVPADAPAGTTFLGQPSGAALKLLKGPLHECRPRVPRSAPQVVHHGQGPSCLLSSPRIRTR